MSIEHDNSFGRCQACGGVTTIEDGCDNCSEDYEAWLERKKECLVTWYIEDYLLEDSFKAYCKRRFKEDGI